MNTLDAYLSGLPPARLLVLCLALVSVVGVLDYKTGYGMNVAVLYVADDKTGEVLYSNDQFRRAFPDGSKLPALPQSVHEGEFHDTGRGRWYLVHSRPMRWIDGRIVRLQLATDITERRRSEALFA